MKLADRVGHFSESVIREMTRLAARHGAINLGQGMPDFETPAGDQGRRLPRRSRTASTSTPSPGAPRRCARRSPRKVQAFNGIPCDPDRNVTVCCGATECMMATMLALVDPGDEVVIFQPFYENYGPDAILSGAKPVWVPLRPPHWTFDPDELRRAFSPRTKAIILNTPNNPTGHVFTREELTLVAELCQEYDAFALADEIYEYIIHTDRPHISIASLPGMPERTVTISGLSKTFSVTGWRLGYCIAPAAVSDGIRKAHDFLTVGAPHPLQMAGVAALSLPQTYYDKLKRRLHAAAATCSCPTCARPGLTVYEPEGAYYVMTDISPLGWDDDTEFVPRDDRAGRRLGGAGEQLLFARIARQDDGPLHVRQAGRDAACRGGTAA